MLKNLLLVMAILFSLSSFSLAKDGPFPLKNSVGLWQESHSGLKVEISTGKFYSGRAHVLVRVFANTGRLVAAGVAIHRLNSESLEVVVYDVRGNAMVISLKDQGNAGIVSLVVNLDYAYGGKSVLHDVILKRL